MGTIITFLFCDKNSNAVNVRSLEITTMKETADALSELFKECDEIFSNYYYEVTTDKELTDYEKEIINELDIDFN
jgi:hypothetical protein